jgi:hypothetical protein
LINGDHPAAFRGTRHNRCDHDGAFRGTRSTIGTMYPRAGEVLHFSEDPGITEFVPHVAATAQQPDAFVWAVDRARSPDYWFPRDCPRVTTWVTARTTPGDGALLGIAARVHVIEYGWLPAMRSTLLYGYRLAADTFAAYGEESHAQVSTEAVRPLAPPEPVGDLLAAHHRAGIELRLASNLWQYVDAWMDTSLGCSAIRMANAQPRK